MSMLDRLFGPARSALGMANSAISRATTGVSAPARSVGPRGSSSLSYTPPPVTVANDVTSVGAPPRTGRAVNPGSSQWSYSDPIARASTDPGAPMRSARPTDLHDTQSHRGWNGDNRNKNTDFGSRFGGSRVSNMVAGGMMDAGTSAPRLGGSSNLKSVYTSGAGVNHGGGMSPALVPGVGSADLDMPAQSIGRVATGSPLKMPGASIAGPSVPHYPGRAMHPEGLSPGLIDNPAGMRFADAGADQRWNKGGMLGAGGLNAPDGVNRAAKVRMPSGSSGMAPPPAVGTPSPSAGITGPSATAIAGAKTVDTNNGWKLGQAIPGAGMGLGAVGLGMAGAGMTSYMTGGNAGQGAAAGGVVGGMAALGAAGMGTKGFRSMIRAGNRATGRKATSFTSNLSKLGKSIGSSGGIAATFGSGALLGGFTFGGDRSHKRGFNSKRGNSIGR